MPLERAMIYVVYAANLLLGLRHQKQNSTSVLTLKDPSKIAADDTFIFYCYLRK